MSSGVLALAWRLARRDLRGGRQGLFVVLLCLAIGVAAVAGIGSLRTALTQGIAQNGRAILGGDLELSTGLAPFPARVPDWFRARGARVTATASVRSILVAPSGRRLLTAVRAVGPGWPMLGAVATDPPGRFARLADRAPARSGPADSLPGLLLATTGARSLGLHPGDVVSLGGVRLAYRGAILDAPDSIADSRLFGVKSFVASSALAGSGLLQPGGLVTFNLQVALPPGASVDRVVAAFRHDFPATPWRLRRASDAAPDLTRFVDQTGLFMSLLALAALVVGGIGVANGVEAWLAARARSIATLRCLGASARLIWAMFGMQLLLLAVIGIVAGLFAGALLPHLLLPLLGSALPLPADPGPYPRPLLLAGSFGLLVAFVFALGPLRRAAAIPGGALFRAAGLPARLPFSSRALLVRLAAVLALVALASLSLPRPLVALAFCAGTGATLLLLRGTAWLMRRLLPLLPTPRRDAALLLALRRLRGPASSLATMLLSIGTGLTVLVAVAEIRGTLATEFNGALPAHAPSFYFIDIQPRDLPTFRRVVLATGDARDISVMPSLRARILAVRGVPVEQFQPPEGSAWPLRSDIGFTYAARPPGGTRLARGRWWSNDYLGPPLVSIDARIAGQWGVRIGDRIAVNVLGRSFDLRVASLRDIDWRSLQLNFLLVGTPDPFAGAPHTLVATVRATPGGSGRVLAAVTDALPEVTGIDVGTVLAELARLVGQIGLAVSLVGLIALVCGSLVLVSAVVVEREARVAEAVVLRTLGATRGQIRRIWLIEFAVAGGAAGLAAAVLGTIAAVVALRTLFHIAWHIQPLVVLATLGGSIALMLLLGFASTASALRQPPAARLRREAGS